MKWFDKTTERYMTTISKEEDLEIGMAKRVYIENMNPEDAVIDILRTNVGYVTAYECIDAWNKVVLFNIRRQLIILILTIYYIISKINI